MSSQVAYRGVDHEIEQSTVTDTGVLVHVELEVNRSLFRG